MNDLLYNEMTTALSDILNEDELKQVMNIFCCVIQKYTITKNETNVVPYVGIPNCLKEYLVSKKLEGCSMATVSQYKLALGNMFQTIGKPVEDITTNDIRVYLYNYQRERGISMASLNYQTIIICTFFKWAEASGYIQTNICRTIKTVKTPHKERGFLSEEELERLRDAAPCLRDKAIIDVLYSTGCRVSELIGIKLSDYNATTGEILVTGKGSKQRRVYLNARAKNSLSRYLKTERYGDDEHMFVSRRQPCGPITKSAVELLISNMGEKAQIGRKVFPHLIRHTTATLALQRGMDVTEIQSMLGHSSIGTTLIYAKTADEKVKSDHKKYIV